MKKVSLAVLAALVVSTPLAAQQTRDPLDDRFYIAPYGSFIFADKDRKTDNGWGGGLAIGKPLNEYLNLELRGDYQYLDNDNGPGADHITQLGANALFFFRREGFQPYLTAGIGEIRDHFSSYNENANPYSNQHHQWSFAANGGVGFLVPISDYLLVRAEGLYRWDKNRGDIRDEDGFGDWIINAGLQIPIGEKPRAAVAPPPPPPPATRTIELSADALFAFNKAVLSPQGIAQLDKFLQELQGASFSSILVVGHTDPFGTDAYNMQLSQRRADAVMNYMVSRGVPADRIRAEGRGESQLKVTEQECAARGARTKPQFIQCYQPNRRVEVTVTGAAPVSQ
ncbi:MAG: OmpA family protein [Candidatus Competibacteraceae bacterium]